MLMIILKEIHFKNINYIYMIIIPRLVKMHRLVKIPFIKININKIILTAQTYNQLKTLIFTQLRLDINNKITIIIYS